MTRSLGGRVRGQRTPRRTFQRRGAANAPIPACLTESFTGASWPIGSDLTWDEGHWGTYDLFVTPTVFGDGSDPNVRTLHVVGSELTVKAPDDSQLPGGENWIRTQGYARTVDALTGPDMTVTATIGGVSNTAGAEWILIARNEVRVDEQLWNGFAAGWVAFYQADYVFIIPVHDDPFAPGFMTSGFADNFTAGNPGFLWTPSDGDEIGLTVTGIGSSTVVTCEAPVGSTAFTLDQGNNWGDALLVGDENDFIAGDQAGCGLFLQSTNFSNPWDRGWDDVTTLDDWEACPA